MNIEELEKFDVDLHSQYENSIYGWIVCRDCIEGETAVKMKNEFYLPMPAAMLLTEAKESSVMTFTAAGSGNNKDALDHLLSNGFNPNYHSNKPYAAYLSRAQFPELASFILRGLMGLALSDKPTVKLPKSMEYLKKTCNKTNQTLEEYYSYLLQEVLTTGRMLSTLDVNDAGELVMVPYVAESLINWKIDRNMNSANGNPTALVLVEHEENDNDPLSSDLEMKLNVLMKDADGNYSVRTYIDKDEYVDKTIEYKGKKAKGIPVTIFGPMSNTLAKQQSPLYSVASTSIQIYMKYADLSNSEFMGCSPMLVISGVEEEFKPKAVGATVALILSNPEAKAYYTKTDTSALAHVLSHITDLYEQAVYAGAQLLDSSKKAAESAETARLKQTSSGATLASVVRNVAKGVEDQLKAIAEWKGENPDEVEFLPITEFMAPALTAQEQRAMVENWLDGALSRETMLDNFRRAGALQEGDTVEDEIAKIEAEIAAGVKGNRVVEKEESDKSDDKPMIEKEE